MRYRTTIAALSRILGVSGSGTAVVGQSPGSRLLAIVGASHKGYYEAYLNQMHDVKLTDATTVLR